jgi:hypothetical protein
LESAAGISGCVCHHDIATGEEFRRVLCCLSSVRKGCYLLPYCLLSRVWAGKATAVIDSVSTGLELPCHSSERPLTTPYSPLCCRRMPMFLSATGAPNPPESAAASEIFLPPPSTPRSDVFFATAPCQACVSCAMRCGCSSSRCCHIWAIG